MVPEANTSESALWILEGRWAVFPSAIGRPTISAPGLLFQDDYRLLYAASMGSWHLLLSRVVGRPHLCTDLETGLTGDGSTEISHFPMRDSPHFFARSSDQLSAAVSRW